MVTCFTGGKNKALKLFRGEIMNRLILWDAIEQGIQGPNKSIAIVKLNTDIRKDMTQMLRFDNDANIKAKGKLAVRISIEAAYNGARYNVENITEALQILKSLGYELHKVSAYYEEGLPIILTCDGEVAVVVAPEHWDSLSNLKASVISKVIPLGPEGAEEVAGT